MTLKIENFWKFSEKKDWDEAKKVVDSFVQTMLDRLNKPVASWDELSGRTSDVDLRKLKDDVDDNLGALTPKRLLVVSKYGGDFDNIPDALSFANSLATTLTPYGILVHPGIWNMVVDSLVLTNPNVVISGTDRNSCIITSSSNSQTILATDLCCLANLTVDNTSSYLLSDNFNDNDLDLTKWTYYNANSEANIAETNERLEMNYSSEIGVYTSQTFEDFDTSVMVQGVASNSYFYFVWQDPTVNNGWGFRLLSQTWGYYASGVAASDWDVTPPTYVIGQNFTLRLVKSGTSVKYYIDGTLVKTVSNGPATENVFYLKAVYEVYYDDFAVIDTGAYSISATSGDTVYLHNVQLNVPTDPLVIFKEYEIQTNVPVKDGITIDGVDISALETDVGGFPDELKNLVTAEIQQLENIGATTISAEQWGYLGACTAAGGAILDDADNVAQLVTLGLTATAAELNILDGALLTVTELNYVDGVTGAIQGQLDLLAPLASPTFTGAVTIPSTADDGTYTGIVTNDTGVLKYRTKAQILSDIGAAASAHLHDTQTLQLDGVNSDGGAFPFNTTGIVTFNQIVASITPTATTHLTTKGYVDSVAQGLNVHPAVAVATTANITLSGEQTIDGILTSASRILVKDQTSAIENGLYISAAAAFSRTTDMDVPDEVAGSFVFVTGGTVNSNTGWVCTNEPESVAIGTDNINFSQFSDAGYIDAGTGLTKTGNLLAVNEAAVDHDNLLNFLATEHFLMTAITDLEPTFEATFVKKVDTVNVLSDITSTGANIEDAVTKKHAIGGDTTLGAQAQDLNMGTHKVTALTAGTASTDAINKSQHDKARLSAKKVLDYMEYANNTDAQNAYVSSEAYGLDILTGGTPSADSDNGAGYEATLGCDNNEATRWTSTNTTFPHWWKYDLGAGVTKNVGKLRIMAYRDADGATVKDFKLQGSNNDADWDDIHTGQQTDDGNWQEYTFSNSTAYRYYRIYITTNWRTADDHAGFWETEMMENILQCYSESTIKTQGSYSLKVIAKATDSLNDTLTRTLATNIDLSDKDTIQFKARASRTGSNFQIQITSGATTTTHDVNIASADTWQTETWDISAVTNDNKWKVASLVIKIIEATVANTIYIDDWIVY